MGGKGGRRSCSGRKRKRKHGKCSQENALHAESLGTRQGTVLHTGKDSKESVTTVTSRGTVQRLAPSRKAKETGERQVNGEKEFPKEAKEASMGCGRKKAAGTAGSGPQKKRKERKRKEQVEQIRWKKQWMMRIA